MHNSNFVRLWYFFSILFCISNASAQFTSPDDIQNQVHQAIVKEYSQGTPNSTLDIQINPVNSTLQLPRCMTPLEVTLPFRSGQRITARASCYDPFWRIFVTAQVRHLLPIVTTTRPLSREHIIRRQDVALVEQDIIRLQGDFFTDLADVIGKQLKNSVGNQHIISSRALEQAIMIKAGEQVTIESRRGTLTIRALGIAQEDGNAGDQISVKNTQSELIIRAVVVQPGLVRVP